MVCVQSYCRLPDVPLEQEWVSYMASLLQPSSVPLCDPRYIYMYVVYAYIYSLYMWCVCNVYV
jgi:hypothetical protein